jgi:predicted rRNA methylase YqxC with S4 and FtsJ domains
MDRFDPKKLSEMEGKEDQIKITNSSQPYVMWASMQLGKLLENIKILDKERLCYNEMKQRK